MSAERLIEDSLNDILEAARNAIKFVDEIDSAVLADDDKTEYAVIRALEIVGEAADESPSRLENRIPKSPGAKWPACATSSFTIISVSTSTSFSEPFKRTFPL